VIHLDTSFLIRALVPGTPENARLRHWVDEATPLTLSAIALCEFLCGERARRGDLGNLEAVLGPVVPVGPDEAELAARLFNESGRRRSSLNDCLVAATAVLHGASLATCNVAHFSRFRQLSLEAPDED
jgi:predicted nucleic acid-binding protein